ncbi:UNVERIFIED_CONTAM: hypothetical protein HHA_291660 [Hammondia hammondi]|eukprot:XP_008887924.1 hypothetical protein HHA_291660 [Hammondia hammondi]
MAAEFLTLLDHSRRQTAEYFQEVEHLEEKRQALEKALAQATSEKQQLQQHTVTREKGLLAIESEKQTASLRLLLQQTEVNSLKAKVEEIERIRSAVTLSTNDSRCDTCEAIDDDVKGESSMPSFREKHRIDCSALLQTIRSSDIRTVADAAREQATLIKKNVEQSEEALTSVRADIYAQKSDISITEATLQSLQREVQELRSQHTNLASSLEMSSSFSATKGSDLDQLRQAETVLSAKRSALLQETARLRDETYHGKSRKI